MIISPDITIQRNYNINEVLIELDGKIESVRLDLTGQMQGLSDKVRILDDKLTQQIIGVQENQKYISGQIEGINGQISTLTNLIVIFIAVIPIGAMIYGAYQKRGKITT